MILEINKKVILESVVDSNTTQQIPKSREDFMNDQLFGDEKYDPNFINSEIYKQWQKEGNEKTNDMLNQLFGD